MEQIGYVLIDSNGEQVKDFTEFPNPIKLTNGDDVYAASVGETLSDGSKIVNLMRDDVSPGEWYDKIDITRVYTGTEVIITSIYSPTPNLDRMRQSMSCTPFQGRMALSDAGLLSQVEAAIQNADEKTRVAWEYALIWERMSPMIVTLMAALAISDTQADDLFKAAQQISA